MRWYSIYKWITQKPVCLKFKVTSLPKVIIYVKRRNYSYKITKVTFIIIIIFPVCFSRWKPCFTYGNDIRWRALFRENVPFIFFTNTCRIMVRKTRIEWHHHCYVQKSTILQLYLLAVENSLQGCSCGKVLSH